MQPGKPKRPCPAEQAGKKYTHTHKAEEGEKRGPVRKTKAPAHHSVGAPGRYYLIGVIASYPIFVVCRSSFPELAMVLIRSVAKVISVIRSIGFFRVCHWNLGFSLTRGLKRYPGICVSSRIRFAFLYSGWPAIQVCFGFHFADSVQVTRKGRTFYNILMGYDPILSGLICCGLYAKPFAWERTF